jgi:hypothetical protein
MEAFEKWLDSLVLQIGQQNVMQYLDEASRWNTKCQLQNTQLKCDFSQQAKTVLKQLKNFDTQDCMIWFSNAVVIGKGDVLNYLAQLR